jgi:ankyrin repeat protein
MMVLYFKIFIARCVDTSNQDKEQCTLSATALHISAFHSHPEVMRYLLDKGAHANASTQ